MLPGFMNSIFISGGVDQSLSVIALASLAGANSTSNTFSDVPLGNAPLAGQNRYIYAFVHYQESASSPQTLTLNGNTATVITVGDSTFNTRWFAVEAPTGTTGTIVAANGITTATRLHVYAVYNVKNPTTPIGNNIASSTSSGTGTLSTTITSQPGAAVLGVIYRRAGTSPSASLTNPTNQLSSATFGNWVMGSGAKVSSATSETVTGTFGGTGASLQARVIGISVA